MVTSVSDISKRLQEASELFDQRLAACVGEPAGVPPELLECVRYSLLAPGKRLRPYLLQRSHELCGGAPGAAEHLAVAVECAHVFTLIHDDLPCMDDAELRRGRPASHRVHGEALAVLAGDTLLALAFELAARPVLAPETCLAAVRELAEAIGWHGVIGGQVSDIEGERLQPVIERVESIHARKTARLTQCCCRLGALAAGADLRTLEAFSTYGLHLGLAFQIADDLLDVTGRSEHTGKSAGGDARKNKQTFPAVVGIDSSSRTAARSHVAKAVTALSEAGKDADDLRDLAEYVIQRTR